LRSALRRVDGSRVTRLRFSMAETPELDVRRLEEWRTALANLLAEARDRAEDLAAAAETVRRHTKDQRGIDQLLVSAVRVRDDVEQALDDLQR
jgi:hypothetical protein